MQRGLEGEQTENILKIRLLIWEMPQPDVYVLAVCWLAGWLVGWMDATGTINKQRVKCAGIIWVPMRIQRLQFLNPQPPHTTHCQVQTRCLASKLLSW